MTDIRDALIGLNDAIDLYWNEGRTEGQIKNICYWQFKAKEALAADRANRFCENTDCYWPGCLIEGGVCGSSPESSPVREESK